MQRCDYLTDEFLSCLFGSELSGQLGAVLRIFLSCLFGSEPFKIPSKRFYINNFKTFTVSDPFLSASAK